MRKVTIQLTVKVALILPDDQSIRDVVDSFDHNIYIPHDSKCKIEAHTVTAWITLPRT